MSTIITNIDNFLDVLEKSAHDDVISYNGSPLRFRVPSPCNESVGRLAKALSSGKCPSGLELNLRSNFRGDAGAAQLAKALSSGRCQRLTT
jgi:hypothetical protein